MKILQLNLWEGRLIRRALSFIQREQPDIVCLQEAFSCDTRTIRPDRTFNSVQLIAQRLGHSHIFFAPLYGFNVGNSYVEYGNAIVSKFPLKNTQISFTHGQYPRVTSADYNKDIHNIQIAQIELEPTHYLTLANYHGYVVPNPYGNMETIQTMRNAKEAVNSYHKAGPLIICGDMNVIAESPAMRVWDDITRSLTAEYRIPTTLSILGKTGDSDFIGNQQVACDHILVSEEVYVKNFYAIEDLISDHKGLFLECQFRDIPRSRAGRSLAAQDCEGFPLLSCQSLALPNGDSCK